MSHYYDSQTGEARHFTPKKDGRGNRPTTVADARAHGYLPSITTILKVLDKPALTIWKVKMGVLAVATDPGIPGETIDQKIERVLETEKQQDEEASIARDKGSAIHDAIELALNGKPYDPELKLYVPPVVDAVLKSGRIVSTEKVVMHPLYAGRMDCQTESDDAITVWDFKTCSTIPKYGSYPEHKMQTAAEANCMENPEGKQIITANCYIYTKAAGEVAVFAQDDWQRMRDAFLHLVRYWRTSNGL